MDVLPLHNNQANGFFFTIVPAALVHSLNCFGSIPTLEHATLAELPSNILFLTCQIKQSLSLCVKDLLFACPMLDSDAQSKLYHCVFWNEIGMRLE
jgi:hypothetical protein